MSNKTKDILDEVLDVAESTTELVEKKPDTLTIKRDETLEDVDADYKYQRENFYNLIERGQDAIDGILEVAQQSDHPSAFEVAGNLISQVADVTEKLGKLQSAMKRLKEVPNNAPKNVTNALYVGSTAELQKLLRLYKLTNTQICQVRLLRENKDIQLHLIQQLLMLMMILDLMKQHLSSKMLKTLTQNQVKISNENF